MTQKVRGAQNWYEQIRARNVYINIFRTYYRTSAAFSFRYVRTPTSNVHSWSACIARFAVESINISTKKYVQIYR